MSYQYRAPGEVHRLNEFVPTYVPHSDYLPTNRVVDSNLPEAQRWVFTSIFSSPPMSNRKDSDASTPINPLSSTPPATFQFVPTKT